MKTIEIRAAAQWRLVLAAAGAVRRSEGEAVAWVSSGGGRAGGVWGRA
jgi:hypothetical protein